MNESLFGFLRPISAHHYHHLASRNFWAEMHIPKMFASALVALEFLLCKNKTWIMEFYAQAKTHFEKQEFKISCFSFDSAAAASSFLFSFSEGPSNIKFVKSSRKRLNNFNILYLISGNPCPGYGHHHLLYLRYRNLVFALATSARANASKANIFNN